MGDVRDLTFRFLGVDAGAGRQFDRMAGKAGVTGGAIEKMALGATAAAGVVAVASIKMAGNFQNAVMHLQTDAGESAKNLKMVSDGILKMAGSVGVSAQELTKGMYYVESAGYHGAAALQVLQAAAEGAKVGNADLKTMADAVTSALNAYRLKGSDAVTVTNEMIGAVSHGKMQMEDLAGALGKVLPAASTAHIGLSQVLGAIATMTAQGTDAANAATYLRQTILQLENPTQKAQNEMKGLGLSSIDVSKNLGKRGLTGTLDVLVNAIEKKMGPAGTVLIESLKKQAKHTTEFQKILANLNPEQQTYVAALANMVGGTKSMQAALELTGSNAKVFNENVRLISEEAKHAGKNVKDWDVIQGTFNFKLDKAKASTNALMIALGNDLLPVATKVMDWVNQHGIPALEKFGGWFSRNKTTIGDFAKVILPVAAAFKAVSLGSSALSKITGTKALGGGLLGGAVSRSTPVPVFVTNEGFGAPGGKVPGMPPVGTPTSRRAQFAQGTLRVGASLVQGAAVMHMLNHAGTRPIDKAAAVAAGGFTFGGTGGELNPGNGGYKVTLQYVDVGAEKSKANLAALNTLLIGTASQAQGAGSKTDALARSLYMLPKNIQTHVTVDDAAAKREIASLITPKTALISLALAKNASTQHVASILSSGAAGGFGLSVNNARRLMGTNAGGTPNWRGGLTWVGENGRELVDLPAGSAVYDHGRSSQMARGDLSDITIAKLAAAIARAFGSPHVSLDGIGRRQGAAVSIAP